MKSAKVITKKNKSKKKMQPKVQKEDLIAVINETIEGENSEEGSDDELLEKTGKMDRGQYLENLKNKDPEFFAAMMSSADVMDVNSSDEDNNDLDEDDDDNNVDDDNDADDDDDDDDDDDEEERGGKYYEPPEQLEVDSDDDEDPTHSGDSHNIVTSQMIKNWEKNLKSDNPLTCFRDVEQGLLAAIESLGGSENKDPTSRYKVEGPQMFNAVVRLCLQHVGGALQKILRLKSPDDNPSKSKRWVKMRNFIKPYLRDIIMLLEAIAEPGVAEVVLKRGVIPLLGYYIGQPSTCRALLRCLITLWATSHQRVRVVAFIAIFRVSHSLKAELLDWVLKRLYLSYVQNCRFTSPSSWGMIDFMRVSLVELYSMDHSTAYRQAFVYIRQMAFHLRNAIMIQKKDRVQLVYNWQYIHCINLWTELLSKTHPSPVLQPLIYPLTQIAIGTMKLQPSAKYYPLVFHVCSILTELSRNTSTFIPVLPFLLEVLLGANLNKKHKKVSIKPFQWLCMLKLSKSQMDESAFKDGIVEQVYGGILNYLSVESTTIGFPELTVPAIIRLKSFLKNSRAPNYTKKVKQLIEKIKENSSFISNRRKDVKFNISDIQAVKIWETEVRQAGTPLSNFYDSWKKVHDKDLLRQLSGRDQIDDYNLPVVKKRELIEKQKAKDKIDMKELFASDEEDFDDDNDRFLSKTEKKEKRKAEESKKIIESEDDEEIVDSPSKKSKSSDDEDDESSIDDEIDQVKSKDVVKEMNFSDFEEEEEEENDDYGVESNSNESEEESDEDEEESD